MDKEKQRCGRKENNSRRDDRARHCSHMSAAFAFFDCTQGNMLSIFQAHAVDIYIELPTSTHAFLMLCLCDSRFRDGTLWNYDNGVHDYVIERLEVNLITFVF